MPNPVYLIIQGELRPEATDLYQQYLQAVAPLMREYGVEVAAVGAGINSPHTTAAHPINAVLRFPDQTALEQFLGDPRYFEIKTQYRDPAYQTLHLAAFQSRPPRQLD